MNLAIRPLALALTLAVSDLQAAPPAADSATTSRQTGLDRIETAARIDHVLNQIQDELDARRYDESLKLSTLALALESDNPFALNGKGASLVQLGRLDEARAAFERAIELKPDLFQAQYNLGEILFVQEKYSDAAAHFQAMAGKHGPTSILKFKLYLCHLLGGQPERAREALAAIRYSIDGPAWYFAHAAGLIKSGDTAKGRQLITTAAAIHGKGATLYRQALRDAGILK